MSRRWPAGADEPARRILDERLARGEISEQEHASRRAALDQARPSAGRGWGPGRWAAAAVAAAALVAGGTLAAVTMTSGVSPGRPAGPAGPGAAGCSPGSLAGQVVEVTLTDHGGMGGGMGGGMTGGGMTGGGTSGAPGDGTMGGMMRVLIDRASVPSGPVSFDVRNAGTLTHELVVLPLPAGQPAGSRAVGPDGAVSETGSLGEASATCRPGHGDGIAAGASGWVTLRLRPGRYELVCNIPGHYAHGMHAELDVR